MRSKKYKLNSRDFVKGLIIAILAAALSIVQNSLSAGQLIFDYKLIITTSLSAGVAYLIKNIFEGDK
jgi:hypothetical protein